MDEGGGRKSEKKAYSELVSNNSCWEDDTVFSVFLFSSERLNLRGWKQLSFFS